MKKLLLCCVILACSSICFAQTAPDSFKFGAQTVQVPVCEGFVNVFGRDAELTAHLKSTMEANNELLAVYLTKDDVLRRECGAKAPPGFYASVISMKDINDINITPQLFSAVIARQEKPFPIEIDPKNKEIISTVDKVEKGLIGDPPVVLGWFDKQPDSFGAMVLRSYKVVGVPIAAAATMSFVLANKRIVYLMVFRIVNDVDEVAALTDFVKKWSAQIKAANK